MRAVPAGLIEYHRHVLVLADRLGKMVEEHLHRFSIHVGQHESESVIGARFDAGEDVGEREAVVAQARRALSARPPDAAGSSLLADPRFVLEEQPELLAFMCSCNFCQQPAAFF